MACISPLSIRNPLFDPSKLVATDNLRRVIVPCGHCVECRKAQSDSIAMRIKHERITQNYKSVFVTFTFDNEHLPSFFDKRPLQLFFKRLRRRVSYLGLPYKIKYFSVGEFGHKFGRSHYHSIILGVSKSEIEALIKHCWNNGFVNVKDCDANSSYYCTKYMRKSSSSAWWSPDSPKYFFDLCLKLLMSQVRNGLVPDPNFRVLGRGSLHYRSSSCVGPRVVVVDDSPFSSSYSECRHCPFAAWSKQLLLNAKRVSRQKFNNDRKISFSWSSLGIGKQYALEHYEDIICRGYIQNGFSKDGSQLVQPIPRNYKNYFLKKVSAFIHPSHKLVYSDIFPAQSSWVDSYNRLKNDDSFIRFARNNHIDYRSLSDPTACYSLLHEFKRWYSVQMQPIIEDKDKFYEQHFRGKSWIGSYCL